MTKNVFVPVLIVTAVVFGGGGFFGGQMYAKKSQPQSFTFGNGERGMMQGAPTGQMGASGNANFRAMRGGTAGGGMTMGEVLSKDDNSLTVKLQDGGSKLVLFSDTTTVMQTSTSTMADVEVGANVMVMGTANDDGSVTAQNVSLR